MKNICGNDASPRQGDVHVGDRFLTLRIGLISSVPAAQSGVRWREVIFAVILLIGMTACTSRIVYETSSNVTLASSNAVNINTASADELEKLPHIGRKTAEAIVAYREENGPFRRVEHLMLIKGVSEKRFAELRPLLRTE